MQPSPELPAAAEALNAWEAPQIGRAWQLMLLRSGNIILNGQQYPYGTVAISHDQYELRPHDPALPRFITTDAAQGWALHGVVQDGAVISLSDSAAQLNPETELLAAAESRNADIDPSQQPRAVRIGHSNFAHFLWNNLPALISWESEVAARVAAGEATLHYYPASEGQFRSLGSPEELLPKLAQSLSETYIWPPVNSLRLGSTLVSLQARERVMASLKTCPPTPASEPRLWLGVRPPNRGRSPLNTVQFFRELVTLWPAVTGGDVVVDCYTPSDKSSASNHDEKRIQEAAAVVDSIVQDVPQGVRILTTRDLLLRESLALAGGAAFYVCSPGTIQHKIGWILNKPGLILESPNDLRVHHVRWPGIILKAGLIPETLPLNYVAWCDSDQVDFTIVDVARAAQWCVDHALTVLGDHEKVPVHTLAQFNLSGSAVPLSMQVSIDPIRVIIEALARSVQLDCPGTTSNLDLLLKVKELLRRQHLGIKDVELALASQIPADPDAWKRALRRVLKMLGQI
ncbi:MAG: hypothetical protein ACKO8I_15275 [Cyanobacteriota bacterium]